MSRFNDILQTIRGGVEEEPKPKSGIDIAKDFLKAAAMTTVAGAVGGTAGMQALGGYAKTQTANREKRRLDKIARAKEELAAVRDISAIEEGERRTDIAERDQFLRQVERTEEGQQRLRELQLKLKQDATVEADRNQLEREKWGIKKADNVRKAQDALKKKQILDAERKVRNFYEKASKPLINTSDDQIAENTAILANQFRQEFGVQTADQAARTWDGLVAEGKLKFDRATAPQTRQRLIDKFAAEEKIARDQAMVRAGFPTGGISPTTGAISALAQYEAIPPDAELKMNEASAGTTGSNLWTATKSLGSKANQRRLVGR